MQIETVNCVGNFVIPVCIILAICVPIECKLCLVPKKQVMDHEIHWPLIFEPSPVLASCFPVLGRELSYDLILY
jgi:hypothetical protein